MELSYNPYIIFASSTTPAGLYARKKWLNQELTPQWMMDFQGCVEAILAHQSPDGSWQGSSIETVRNLFALHLTIREANQEINNALDWLIEQATDTAKGLPVKSESLSNENLRGLPFTPGSFAHFLVSATLFLATIFKHEYDADILAMYEWRTYSILAEKDRPPGWASVTNMLRALVVHPMYSQNTATEKLVTKLAGVQEGSGRWRKDINTYQTVNALAHLDLEEAESQVQKAFGYLATTQNKDGTWGNVDHEWNTFLVVHAMKKKGVLD
jgi:hypothetical protein